ncbi:protein SpAN-like [Saccoglossus kowalevskii]|uniref:Metalloendopeptidase n=1 Tax=Saccoglossus kowalevskii TaxID=10224 RepID=A0ABM0M9Y0_SACKO|nr:PREDICTED: protein SpAN-like [Saccoglossus kowalevskii]
MSKYVVFYSTACIFMSVTMTLSNGNKIELPAELQGKDTFEGDMKLTADQFTKIEERIEAQKHRIETRKAYAILSTRWEDAIVPYRIEPESQGDTAVILSAIAHWESKTCIRFPQYDPAEHTSFISFTKQDGCWSYIGKVFTGAQEISIGIGCEHLGTIAHEIGHAIGFFHEQSRPDRDSYVIINEDNIIDGYEDNFQKYDTGTIDTHQVPYDIGSLMHYGERYFSKNGLNTIDAVNPADQSKMGQRDGLSDADILLANLMYKCPGVSGDPHMKTFDGRPYTFQGVCWYTLFKDCFYHKPDFEVAVKFEPRGDSTTDHFRTRAVAFNVSVGMEYANVNGLDVITGNKGHDTAARSIRVQKEQNVVILEFTSNNTTFTLEWALRKHALKVNVQGATYNGRLCGLMGNADGDTRNDFQTPDGNVVLDAAEFGESWEVKGQTCE